MRAIPPSRLAVSCRPWVGVPPELYGCEATNYNGASARYKAALGEANLNMSMFVGKETVKDSLYQKLYYDSQTRVTWDKLIGGDIELTLGALTVRGDPARLLPEDCQQVAGAGRGGVGQDRVFGQGPDAQVVCERRGGQEGRRSRSDGHRPYRQGVGG